MLGFLPCITLESLGNLGISLAVGLTAHRQVHSHLAALAREMRAQTFQHFRIDALGHADHMFVGPRHGLALDHFLEFRAGLLALRAKFGSFLSLIHVTAYGTDKLLFHSHLSVLV